MDANEISDRFFKLRTDLDRSLRYYAAMRARCELWAFAVQSLCVLASSSVFAAALSGLSETAVRALAFAAAVCASLSLAERASRKADWYLQKRRDFSELLGRVPLDEAAFTVALLEELSRARLGLEADEPPLYGCLSVLCHNEVCEAVGAPEQKVHMSWWQRNVLRFLPVSYESRAAKEDTGKLTDSRETVSTTKTVSHEAVSTNREKGERKNA